MKDPLVAPAPVTILTGPRGNGKSLFCRALAEHASVAGLFSPACELGAGQRYGIDAVLMPGDERFPLARVTDPARGKPGGSRMRSAVPYRLVLPPPEEQFDEETIATGVSLGPFTFSVSAMERAGAGLRAATGIASTRLVIIDEIGPLELEREKGLLEPLKELLRGADGLPMRPLLVVTRPSLVVSLCALVQRERTGCTPETVTTRDFPHPDDSRIIRALTH